MLKNLFTFLLLISNSAFSSVEFDITLFNNSSRELQAQNLLRKLNHKFDLSKIAITNKINIKEREIAHSHPILTLNTRYIDNEVAFFSVFIHEQIHWHLSKKILKTSFKKFMNQVKEQYPNIPVGREQGGARTKHSSYLHLAVILLEYDVLNHYVGRDIATEWFKKNTIYSQLNLIILNDYVYIKDLIQKFKLHIL